MQKDETKIAQCVEIRINLRDELKEIKEVQEKISAKGEVAHTQKQIC